MSAIQFTGIKNYLPASIGMWLAGIGAAGLGIDTVRVFMKKSMMFVRYFGIWLGVFIATLLIVKLPYRIADHIIYDRETSV